MMMDKNKQRVVIVGAGFGGLNAARAFAGQPISVTLIDQNNYHLFQPLLYQVATSTLSPGEIAYPIRATLRRSRNVDFVLGNVQSIDLLRRCVRLDSGDVIYDQLILAVGGITNYFGVPGLEETAFGLKDLEDATTLRNHLLKQFEKAVLETNPAERKAMLKFVIVGGGPTGVELAGAVCELISTILHKDYPHVQSDEVQVLLLEALDRLMAHLPQEQGQWTLETLSRKGIEVRFRAAVSSYDGKIVQLKDGTAIAARTLIWAAGVRASHLLDSLGFEQDRLGRVKVNSFLQVPGHPEVFVIGDAAHALDESGQPLPMLAQVAMQQAAAAVKNILKMQNGEAPDAFEYRDPGVMATIGRNQAVVLLKGMKFYGFIAWIMWLVVHIMQLIGFRNRLVVLLDWFWSYIFYERAARLIGPD
jgi:NADH:ubiquinone reductase (H+-translocating)